MIRKFGGLLSLIFSKRSESSPTLNCAPSSRLYPRAATARRIERAPPARVGGAPRHWNAKPATPAYWLAAPFTALRPAAGPGRGHRRLPDLLFVFWGHRLRPRRHAPGRVPGDRDGAGPASASPHCAPRSPTAEDSRRPGVAILNHVDPIDRLRSAGRRMTDPFETLAQHVAERVLDLIVHALDVNALLQRVDVNALVGRIDMNALLDHVDIDSHVLRKVDVNALLDRVDVTALLDRADINALLDRVDVDALLSRVDVNDLVRRVDMDTLVEQTDLGAVIARSSGGAASEALDAARSQAVGLDQFIDRWAGRLLRRKNPGPSAPIAMLNSQADA